MRVVVFTHSLRSCWNHGNAHFLRGVLRELVAAGHEVSAHEPDGAWSVQNLLRDHGQAGLQASFGPYPELSSTVYDDALDLEAALDGADAVLVHEWNEPELVARIGAHRRRGGRFTLLFHDTHHRAVSDPDAIRRFDLDGYDGVLAFGETLAAVYRRWGWGDRVWVWHEAADVRLFRPPSDAEADPLSRRGRDGVRGPTPEQASPASPRGGAGPSGEVGPLAPAPLPPGEGNGRRGLVWIGNWGDGERSAELDTFLFRPAQAVGLSLDVHGVRYPPEALQALARSGARYRGWLPNARAPETFARHLATVHVPRRFYVEHLPGIPTIRVFEALACGIPLVCAPWRDSEDLFRPGTDYLVAADGPAMERHLSALRDDPALRRSLAESGLETIRARHTCAHRARELLAILDGLKRPVPSKASA